MFKIIFWMLNCHFTRRWSRGHVSQRTTPTSSDLRCYNHPSQSRYPSYPGSPLEKIPVQWLPATVGRFLGSNQIPFSTWLSTPREFHCLVWWRTSKLPRDFDRSSGTDWDTDKQWPFAWNRLRQTYKIYIYMWTAKNTESMCVYLVWDVKSVYICSIFTLLGAFFLVWSSQHLRHNS